MNFSQLKSGQVDVQGFTSAIIDKDEERLYKWHVENTPWVDKKVILQYVKQYIIDAKAIDEQTRKVSLDKQDALNNKLTSEIIDDLNKQPSMTLEL